MLTDDEFIFLQENDALKSTLIAAVMNFQYSLIPYIDDACHMEKEELKPHSHFDFTLNGPSKLVKNGKEERESPQQIIFASMTLMQGEGGGNGIATNLQ